MTTCTWNFRRHAPRVLSAACLVALASSFVVPKASADQISDLKAQASALASRIQTLGRQEAALGEQYDAAQLAVQALNAKVSQAAQQVAAASAHASQTRTALQADAINAYVHGGNDPLTVSNNPMNNATNSLLRAEYVNSLATNQSDAIDEYHLAALQDQSAKADLQRQTTAAQAAVQQVARARRAAAAGQAQLQAALNQDTGRIAVLVAQQQAAAEAAAAAAARARLAAQIAAQQAAQQAAAQQQAAQEAAARASVRQAAAVAAQNAPRLANTQTANPAPVARTPNVVTPNPSPILAPPPPVGSGASGAVAAAESRVGSSYVWGAAGPNSFDCSGLVMWAYAQVGISLPHFSGAQYADTTHISMSQLEPGDLVFPADPGQHVAMYVGNGMIVEAANPAIGVHITPMYSWFVLASRVA